MPPVEFVPGDMTYSSKKSGDRIQRIRFIRKIFQSVKAWKHVVLPAAEITRIIRDTLIVAQMGSRNYPRTDFQARATWFETEPFRPIRTMARPECLTFGEH